LAGLGARPCGAVLGARSWGAVSWQGLGARFLGAGAGLAERATLSILPPPPRAGRDAMTLGLLPNFVNTAALRYFYEVAKYGSFRLAADRIHIAASAISRQIQLLEQELEVKLFARDRKGLRLTAAGEALLYRVRKAINELDIARSEIDLLHGSHKGTVRLGKSTRPWPASSCRASWSVSAAPIRI